MNVVSDANHWMFISSNGALSAGRKNSTYALFPYYTDDKITESADITGSKTILQVRTGGGLQVWEPFSYRQSGLYTIRRNLYKNRFGNKICFEEVNEDLGLTFRYQWNSSNLYGFVRTSTLINDRDSDCSVTVLDGIQNIMPYGVEPDMQVRASNLADAYKRSELVGESGLGIYALSAIIVDKAEPSEALKANIAWSLGIPGANVLLSSLQLDAFRSGEAVSQESDIKGEKGAYFVNAPLSLGPKATQSWMIVANVNQQQSQVIALSRQIVENPLLESLVTADIAEGSRRLLELVAASDGLRYSSDTIKDSRHYANVLFNIMRGGTFDNNYQIEKQDLLRYVQHASRTVFARHRERLESLPDTFDKSVLQELVSHSDAFDPDLYRLGTEYLPLKFSRRHGDPSRPWNQFSINTNSEIDGSKILDYEGNWRDIFQNWEALVHAYPEFIEGMIFKFMNATTFDGYNPYRVTKGGFDWETIEPDDPWSYIGYWGDHQIIYLLKFLEFYRQHRPDGLRRLLHRPCFVYANVPYRIKSYDDIALDPKNTIDFEESVDHRVRAKVAAEGADGALLTGSDGDLYRVNFLEKMLATVLAKMSNFIPEGGIWMNTQRPEWNDANNALVGNGVSMVTLYYLRRFLRFMTEMAEGDASVPVSRELHDLFEQIHTVLSGAEDILGRPISDSDRKRVTDALGQAGSAYRLGVYESGFSGETTMITLNEIRAFAETALRHLEHAIDANRRSDNLYHAYNIMSIHADGISIGHLSEMLEGQVGVLSSGYLGTDEAVGVLDAMRRSALYRSDQNSYMLYPNKELPGFLQKNNIPAASVSRSALLQRMLADGNTTLLSSDVRGGYHFNGNFRNAADLKTALDKLSDTSYASLASQDRTLLLQTFEEVFNHKAFTGRSGTFYAYEGLGSIYWHMVSKLHLAVMEVCEQALLREGHVSQDLYNHFLEIGQGIGVHKTPEQYGAFPTDPYSHTPWHRGAQQPGMTGQVKEDILVSIAELGVRLADGCLHIDPRMLRRAEFTDAPRQADFVDIRGNLQPVTLPAGSLAFTWCQVPVVYCLSADDAVEVLRSDGEVWRQSGLTLDRQTSQELFGRTGKVRQLTVNLREDHLRA